jgi:hypothetical protein
VFHFFGEQGRAVEFDHLQTAVDLMDARQAIAQGVRRLGIIKQGFDRLMSHFQRFGNLAFDPLEGHIVVPITHNHSKSLLYSKKPERLRALHTLSAACALAAGKVKPDTERRS